MDRALGLFSGDEPVEHEQDDRSHDGGNEPGGISIPVPAKTAAEKMRHKRASEAQKDGDNPAAWIFSGHKEFRDRSNEESDENSGDDSHVRILSFQPKTYRHMAGHWLGASSTIVRREGH